MGAFAFIATSWTIIDDKAEVDRAAAIGQQKDGDSDQLADSDSPSEKSAVSSPDVITISEHT